MPNNVINNYFGCLLLPPVVTLPKHLQILPVSPSKPNRRSMPGPYRLPNPLPPLPVRKGVRGRRPKSETIALLKAVAEAAAVHGAMPDSHQLVPRPHKKRGPKPGSKVRPSRSNPKLPWNVDGFIFHAPKITFPRGSPRFQVSSPTSRSRRTAFSATARWFQQVRLHACSLSCTFCTLHNLKLP